MTQAKQQELLEAYCNNEMKKLKQLCYPMLIKIGGITEKDYDDFYSIALEVLADSIFKYDDSLNCQFKSFLIGNIKRKFNTEVRDRNRQKCIPSKQIDSFDALVCENGIPVNETIPDKFDIYEELFGEDISGTKIEKYLSKLSILQRKIVSLLADGYMAKEIKAKLHITNKMYTDNLMAIQAYENIKVLL